MKKQILLILLIVLGASARASDVSVHGEGYIYLENRNPPVAASIPDSVSPLLNTKRFYWEPTRAALRFGETTFGLSNYGWSAPALGFYSFAAGRNTFAVGNYSFAFGDNAKTYGSGSVVMGQGAFVEGNESYALGRNASVDGELWGSYALGFGAIVVQEASGAYAIGMNAYADGLFSYAIGEGAEAYGESSMALGSMSYTAAPRALALFGYASGTDSIAIGGYSSGTASVAIGDAAVSSGEYSIALGAAATAKSPFGLSVGRYNLGAKKDGVSAPSLLASQISADDPVFEIGVGQAPEARQNAFTVYRDATARFYGPVQIKAGSGYLTLQAAGTTNRTLTLPDANATLLSNESQLNATKLTGEIPSASLPADVTRLGSTVDLSSSAVTGELPWSKVAPTTRPNTLAGYGISDGISVQREVIGGVEVISTPLRIKPQGDIPMLVASP